MEREQLLLNLEMYTAILVELAAARLDGLWRTTMLGPPRGFWGKLEKDDDGKVVAWHPNVDHSADVAAVCEALLTRTLLGRRLAHVAGQDVLTGVQVARLGVLTALHDVGKFNVGFQNKALDRSKDVRGHVAEALGVLVDPKRHASFLDALGAKDLATWGDDGMFALLVATICHHGRPVKAAVIVPGWWEPDAMRGLDPFQGVEELVDATRRWFPEAWGDGEPLPTGSEFQHAWSGLVMLADWLGSDSDRFFPFSEEDAGDRMPFARRQAELALASVGLHADPYRLSLGPSPPGYERLPTVRDPRPAQRRILELPTADDGSLAILEAATGSGKTEAALMHFLRLHHAGQVDGLYFALPTRAAATQIFHRVVCAVKHAFPDEDRRPPVVQAVPGYIRVDAAEGVPLPHFQVLWPDDEKERNRYRGWAAEHPKRYLAGAVVVGTVDQVLLSVLMVSHAHMRSTALLRQLLVVDEVHASDTYMARLLEAVLDVHIQAGGHALLMSATLGAAARQALLADPGERKELALPSLEEAKAVPYPAISLRGTAEVLAVEEGSEPKQVRLELVSHVDDADWIARTALTAAADGARVLVIRNTVKGCLAVQRALEEVAEAEGRTRLLFRVAGRIVPHHSRYARTDRKLLDDGVEASFGRERPEGGCVAVATQTVEQSLDIDADLLLSDLCPIDVLLQRIGRLHRHERDGRPVGFEAARTIVLGPEVALASMITPEGKGKADHGFGPVYEDLRALEATRRIVEANPEVTIPADNRRLVEDGTHPGVLDRFVDGTWEPHGSYLRGRYFAERRYASFNVIERFKEFGIDRDSVRFPEGDEARHIGTRLGERDRLVRFAEPMTGPFGREVREISIPCHCLGSEEPSADESKGVHAEAMDGGLTFRFGTRSFSYDRLGLVVA